MPPQYRYAPPVIKTLNTGITTLLRHSTAADITPVTNLILESFAYWTAQGLCLSPARQTTTQTQRHLIDKGFVLEDVNQHKIIATFSIDEGRICISNGSTVNFFEGDDEAIPFTSASLTPVDLNENSRLLVFKKLAVKPDYGKHGIGLMLYKHVEEMARAHSYDGMILETVETATWLYNWYVKLGFKTIGKYLYPNSQVETVLMLKPLK